MILLVEDNEGIRDGVLSFFEWEKLDAVGVGSGEEAVAWARENKPDVVLLDMNLPAMTGLETAQNLESMWGHVPLVVITADGRIESKAETVHADGYLRKPFELDDLSRMVRTFTEESHGPDSDPHGGASKEEPMPAHDPAIDGLWTEKHHRFRNPFKRSSWLYGTGDYGQARVA